MEIFYENKSKDFFFRDTTHPDARRILEFSSHLHQHIELVILKKGHSQFTVDTQIYDAEAGDLVVIFPNQIHSIKTLEPEEFMIMIVNPDIMPEYAKQFASFVPESNLLKGVDKDPELMDIANSISKIHYSDIPFRNDILRGYLLTFFGKLLGKLAIKDIQEKGYDILGIILNYCTANFDKPISLEVLEKDLHISKYYISHTFSSRLHIGFNDYINSLRVSNACKHLRKTDKSITEISYLVGFNTMRTFNRAFKKQLGMTPKEYRMKN